jgi:hypothetical protein
MTEKTYGPHPAAAALDAARRAHDTTKLDPAGDAVRATYDPALGDGASVNRGGYRRELLAQVWRALREMDYEDAAEFIAQWDLSERRNAS